MKTFSAPKLSQLEETIVERVCDEDYETVLASGTVEYPSISPSSHAFWREKMHARARIDALRLVEMGKRDGANHWPVLEIASKTGSSYSSFELSVIHDPKQQERRRRELIERDWAEELAAARARIATEKAQRPPEPFERTYRERVEGTWRGQYTATYAPAKRGWRHWLP